MRLVQPTDFEILSNLTDGKRNVAANIALELDKNRPYVNARFPHLEDYGLVKRIGPSPKSGVYEITQTGKAAVKHRDKYGHPDIDFESLVGKKE